MMLLITVRANSRSRTYHGCRSFLSEPIYRYDRVRRPGQSLAARPVSERRCGSNWLAPGALRDPPRRGLG